MLHTNLMRLKHTLAKRMMYRISLFTSLDLSYHCNNLHDVFQKKKGHHQEAIRTQCREIGILVISSL